MVKFLKLTEVCKNDMTKELLLNAACVQSFQHGTKSDDTYLRMIDGTFFFVTESISMIERQLNPVPSLSSLQGYGDLSGR